MFPAGAQLKRTNFAKITAREADAIEAALRSTPNDIPGIAMRFNRSATTICKIGERRGISTRKCLTSTMTNANEPATSRVNNTNDLSHISTISSTDNVVPILGETDGAGV